jgi:hypothetical protein
VQTVSSQLRAGPAHRIEAGQALRIAEVSFAQRPSLACLYRIIMMDTGSRELSSPLNHSGKRPDGGAAGALEKASQVATVFLAFVMLAIAVELGMLVSLLKGMKLDDPSNSPMATILGDGIKKGALETMDGIDVLGIGALRDGTCKQSAHTESQVESLSEQPHKTTLTLGWCCACGR